MQVYLYNDYRLNVAQNLTRNSVVNRIGDLLAWYETSLPSSFRANEANVNNGNISIWFDNNTLSTRNNNATAQTPLSTANQPILVKNVFNGSIPALRFSGAQYLNFDGTGLAQTNYTIFVVEMRRLNGRNFLFGGGESGTNKSLAVGYRTGTTATQSHWANDLDIATPAYKASTPTVHTLLFSNITGKSYAIDGLVRGTAPSQTTPLTTNIGSRIGSVELLTFYVGDFAEIIIFGKDLNISQIKEVEAYLSKKYGLRLS